ncbi:hypothetical protein [Herminiimonas fonticola]|uniref:Uncharacterized protein n=1 Tax=Herminiimonas fonticola TaxID=303380 RepID=A0A4R6G710_9BURK|nr:hypothetical protein [Herminiimonas fonticola]RBA24292.1 hypothetical protein Hfont_2104 [Herminiimonas fonticola]TDN90293.1 hypothetical protein EV677_2369 [Herminiimonas fonticola]
MNKEEKVWLNTDNGEKQSGQTEKESNKPQALNSDDIKEEEKRYGLVDEDHPFPSKGN